MINRVFGQMLKYPGQHTEFPNQVRQIIAAYQMLVIEPDGKFFKTFSLRNWHIASVLACDGTTVFVMLANAITPNSGSLRLLRKDVHKAGLKFAVIAPLGNMVPILRHWNFTSRIERFCNENTTVWREP